MKLDAQRTTWSGTAAGTRSRVRSGDAGIGPARRLPSALDDAGRVTRARPGTRHGEPPSPALGTAGELRRLGAGQGPARLPAKRDLIERGHGARLVVEQGQREAGHRDGGLVRHCGRGHREDGDALHRLDGHLERGNWRQESDDSPRLGGARPDPRAGPPALGSTDAAAPPLPRRRGDDRVRTGFFQRGSGVADGAMGKPRRPLSPRAPERVSRPAVPRPGCRSHPARGGPRLGRITSGATAVGGSAMSAVLRHDRELGYRDSGSMAPDRPCDDRRSAPSS